MNVTKHWYIFRHGLATHSKNGYGAQIRTAQVLPEGIPPVQRLARFLETCPYDWGARSEFLRCQQTAQIVTDITGRTFVADPRLNERVDEPFNEIVDRVKAFIDDVNVTEHQHVWVCTHGIVIAALKSWLTRGEFSRQYENDYIQPGELLKITPEGVEVVKFGVLV